VNVLVLGSSGNAACNVARALIAAGHRVVGADPDDSLFALFPGECSIKLQSSLSPARAVELNKISHDYAIDCIVAQPEDEVEWLADNAYAIDAWTCVPSGSLVRLCRDKLATAGALHDLAPRSWPLKLLRSDAGYPVWVRAREGAGSTAAMLVNDAYELDRWAGFYRGRGVDMMASAFLPGADFSWTGVYDTGILVAEGQMTRLKLLGSSRGHSSTAQVQETTQRRDVRERAHHAILRVHDHCGELPNGAYKVDLREDAEGCPMVTEINAGRFGTTVDHYAAAGANLPDALVRICSGEQDGGAWPMRAVAGVRWLRNTDAEAMSPNRVAVS
jgi:carbamoyl-phosphate synthase large subunit